MFNRNRKKGEIETQKLTNFQVAWIYLPFFSRKLHRIFYNVKILLHCNPYTRSGISDSFIVSSFLNEAQDKFT